MTHKALLPWQLEHGGKVRCNNFSHWLVEQEKGTGTGAMPCARKARRPRLTKQNELGSYLISAALACVEKEAGGNEIPMCLSKKVYGGE